MTGMKKAGLVTAADEETELAMLRSARERFGAAGFRHYEVSNFARPGRESRHNLAYWTWRDYLGLGAGAHGFAGDRYLSREPASGGTTLPLLDRPGNRYLSPLTWGRRYANIRLPELYMSAGDGRWHGSDEELTREMAIAEYLMVGLRLADGIDEGDFEAKFGLTLAQAAPRLPSFAESGLIERRRGSVALTSRGLEIADSVITQLAAG